MGGPFSEPPYATLSAADFGPTSQYQVAVHHGGRTVALGDFTDASLQGVPTLVQPGTNAVDVVIHGLPGRFIEKPGGSREIPVSVVVELLEGAGIQRGTALQACNNNFVGRPFQAVRGGRPGKAVLRSYSCTTSLGLLTCHAAEAPLSGGTAAQLLATEWTGPVTGPNGLLRIGKGQIRIDLVDWDLDPVLGGMVPRVTKQGQGSWIPHAP
jgi:hypothetical protein